LAGMGTGAADTSLIYWGFVLVGVGDGVALVVGEGSANFSVLIVVRPSATLLTSMPSLTRARSGGNSRNVGLLGRWMRRETGTGPNREVRAWTRPSRCAGLPGRTGRGPLPAGCRGRRPLRRPRLRRRTGPVSTCSRNNRRRPRRRRPRTER